MKNYLLLTLVFFLFASATFSQDITERNSMKRPGGELTGMYIGGGVGALMGGLFGGFIQDVNETSGDQRVPYIVGIHGGIYGSILGLGLGSLFTENHSMFSESFRLGIAWVSSDRFSSKQLNSRDNGLEVQLVSPEIGRFRYAARFNHYFSFDFEQFGEPASRTYWTWGIDLQYIINISDWKLYPFLGTDIWVTHAKGFDNAGFEFDYRDSEGGTNIGVGLERRITGNWTIYTEPRWVFYEKDDRWVLSLGVRYDLF